MSGDWGGVFRKASMEDDMADSCSSCFFVLRGVRGGFFCAGGGLERCVWCVLVVGRGGVGGVRDSAVCYEVPSS